MLLSLDPEISRFPWWKSTVNLGTRSQNCKPQHCSWRAELPRAAGSWSPARTPSRRASWAGPAAEFLSFWSPLLHSCHPGPVLSSLLGIFNPRLTGESPLQSLFGSGEENALCFFHRLMFCRYKKAKCLGLERSDHECHQQLCNPRNGDLEILTATACFKDFKQLRDKSAAQSMPAGSVPQYVGAG